MFKLDFNICQLDCDTLQFTDNTGLYLKGVYDCYKNGYNYPNNPLIEDVVSTEFVITYPNGNVYTVDLGYVPPVQACASFDLSGTSGSIALIADGITIGQAIYIVSLDQTIQDLVNSVNANTTTHNYYASYNGSTITICDSAGGTEANGKVIDICVFELTSSETSITLAGGENDTWCFDFGSGDIDETDVNTCFDDGVYEFQYNVTVDDGEEIQVFTVTKHFIFDCLSNACLRELILLSTSGKCPCNDKDIHDKIAELRTDIEAANVNYQECQYDCANEVLIKTQNYCKNVCLDCD
jgi:hypothetical protein